MADISIRDSTIRLVWMAVDDSLVANWLIGLSRDSKNGFQFVFSFLKIRIGCGLLGKNLLNNKSAKTPSESGQTPIRELIFAIRGGGNPSQRMTFRQNQLAETQRTTT